MTATTANSEESMTAGTWDPQARIEETIKRLLELQAGESRNLDAERDVAQATGKYVHQRDNQDFMICAEVRAHRVFATPYYPRAWLERRDNLRDIAIHNHGSVETASEIKEFPGMVIMTYFYQLELGSDLGYPDELGEKWYLHMADIRGNFYIPIEAVTEIIGTRF